jgi:hypothetical protein
MYVMKVTKDNKILAVRHYKHFENAVADIGDYSPFDDISDDIINSMGEWGNPKIVSCSELNGIADDFEFRYPCGINIYVGLIFTEEGRKENANERTN